MPDATDFPLAHGSAHLSTGVRLHYVTAGTGPRTMVLLHGYPETWYEWRHVLRPFAAAGWRVIAPDYRGAGGSSKPTDGYDKRTMAADVRHLLTDHLGVSGPVTMVGHDIGMMVAYAYAAEYADAVDRLVLMEAPLPGTATWDQMLSKTNLTGFMAWHFYFHNADNNLAESLTAGRERLYLQHFYTRLAFNPDAISPADLDEYAGQFSAAGAMRAGFEVYRAFDGDAAANRAGLAKRGRLKMPVLALGGTASFYLPIAEAMLKEVATDVTVVPIPECGHWIAEEKPRSLVSEVLNFTGTGE